MRHLLQDLAIGAGAVALYGFQEASGNPQDFSGNGFHMTSISAGADYGHPGAMGDRCIRIIGGESIARSSVVSAVQNDFTIEIIMDIEAIGANDQILVHNGNEATNGWGIRVEASGQFRGLAGGVAELNLGSDIDALGFVMLHVLRDSADSNRWKYSVDGVETTANAGNSAPNVPSGTLTLGDPAIQTAYSHVAIYETALSATRRTMHFNAWKSELRKQTI